SSRNCLKVLNSDCVTDTSTAFYKIALNINLLRACKVIPYSHKTVSNYNPSTTLMRSTTRATKSSGRYFDRKSSAPTFSTMALLKTPDSEVCNKIYKSFSCGSLRISAVRV